MRLSRDESRTATRERLIAVARDRVIAGGFDATSINDIAEAAGFTKGAFFSNFENKEALLLELLRRHKTEEVEAMRRILDEAGCDGTGPAFARYIEGLDRGGHWSILDVELQLQASRNPALARRYDEVQQECRVAMGAVITEVFQRAGRQPAGAPEEIARMFLALVNGLVLATAADPARPGFHQHVKAVLHGLLATAPPAAAARPAGGAATPR